MTAKDFAEKTPTSAVQVAAIILSGVRENRWRILIGNDAAMIDAFVRNSPEEAYSEESNYSLFSTKNLIKQDYANRAARKTKCHTADTT